MTRFVIFDFDGTLADTLRTNLQIIKDLGLNHGRDISEKTIEEFKSISTTDFLKKNGISKIKLYFSFQKIKRVLNERMGEVDIFPGIKQELGKMHKAGFRLGILSSNDKKNIDLFLENHEIAHFFDFVFTEKNLFSKDTKLKFIVKILKLRIKDIVYVGDEVRDVEAAKRAGVKNIAVSWGYDSLKIIEPTKPDAIVQNPKQMIKIVEMLLSAGG